MNNQTIVITGAAGGLGGALTRNITEGGGHVLAIDHNQGRLDCLSITCPNRIHPLATDLRSPELGESVVCALGNLPPVSGLVCCAAKSMGNDIFQLKDEDWLESFAINVSPAMVLARALAPMMAASGGGSIVNVGSPVAIVGARKPSYAASKAALSGLALSLARNLGPMGIRVNLFLPGPMITPMTEDWPEEKRAAIAASSFLGRLCRPEESAAAIAFLLSPAASYITGAIIDGTAGSMFGH